MIGGRVWSGVLLAVSRAKGDIKGMLGLPSLPAPSRDDTILASLEILRALTTSDATVSDIAITS